MVPVKDYGVQPSVSIDNDDAGFSYTVRWTWRSPSRDCYNLGSVRYQYYKHGTESSHQ